MMDLPKSIEVLKKPTTEKPWYELVCKDQNNIDDMLGFVNFGIKEVLKMSSCNA